jgi:hypothetical protein
MGLFDVLRGRSTPVAPKLDALFSLPSAAVTLQIQAGLVSSGHAGICWKPPPGQGPEAVQEQVAKLLELDDPDPATPALRAVEDDLGYRWLVIEGAGFEDLATRVHQANSMIVENGWGTQLLCSVFGLRQEDGSTRSGAATYLVYLYKRGTFYPFCPTGPQSRDNEAELRLRSILGSDLPIEDDLGRWMALWGLPLT